MFHADILV